MAGKEDAASAAAAPRRHIRGDLDVPGVLRIAADTICEGNVSGRAGVVLGDGVLVRGDVSSGGPLHLGRGCRIEGRVMAQVANEPAPEARSDAAPSVLEASTIGSILEMLLGVSWTPGARGAQAGPAAFAPDAREDVLDGLVVLIDHVHRRGRVGSQWSADEVFGILLQQVVPLLAPVAPLVRRDREALVRIGRPHMLPAGRASAAGWPDATSAVVQAIGRHLYPGFRIEVEPAASRDPDEVRARVMVGAAGGAA